MAQQTAYFVLSHALKSFLSLQPPTPEWIDGVMLGRAYFGPYETPLDDKAWSVIQELRLATDAAMQVGGDVLLDRMMRFVALGWNAVAATGLDKSIRPVDVAVFRRLWEHPDNRVIIDAMVQDTDDLWLPERGKTYRLSPARQFKHVCAAFQAAAAAFNYRRWE